jgi:hypothetical protein
MPRITASFAVAPLAVRAVSTNNLRGKEFQPIAQPAAAGLDADALRERCIKLATGGLP